MSRKKLSIKKEGGALTFQCGSREIIKWPCAERREWPTGRKFDILHAMDMFPEL